jgi:predicted nucleotidyltransferase
MDLSGNTSLAGLAEAIAAVQEAAAVTSVETYVAGALARDLWMAFGHGLDTGRRTEDVDFAVECADWPAYEVLGVELGHGETRGPLRATQRTEVRARASGWVRNWVGRIADGGEDLLTGDPPVIKVYLP